MNLKFISENKVKEIFASRNFLLIASTLIFALSIFLRSIIDIGPDTGIYLDLGKKIAEGKRYYYDFFESNFPLSFYFYALEYQVSKAFGVSQIMLSELVINSLALISIFWSAKILARSNLAKNQAHYNLIIVAYFLGFFLRPQALPLGEFGTKTSLILLLLYPYFSYSFPRNIPFSKRDQIARGILMGLMPCLKPHYIIFPLVVEIYHAWQKKSPRFLFELDKLIAALIYVSYLFWMIKMMPEFFEMITPMWMKIYGSYENEGIFLGNFFRLIAAHIGEFIFIFLIFTRRKIDENDQILIAFFVAAALLFIAENAMTIDQSVIFYAVATACVSKLAFDFFTSPKTIILQNKFILAALFFIPLFDLGIFPSAIFGLSGFVNIWWLLAPFLIFRNFGFLLLHFLLMFVAIILMKHCGNWAYIAFNLVALFVMAFFYEKKISAKSSENFSPFAVFLIAASISSLFYIYVTDVAKTVSRKENYTYPNKVSDAINYYAKKFAPTKDDSMTVFSTGNNFTFSRINYLKKDNLQKFHTASIQAGSSLATMFQIRDKDSLLVNYYLFDDVRTAIKNPRTKVIFVNNSPEIFDKGDRCIIGALEYYFLDYDFKKFFLKNFRFENRVIIEREVAVIKNIPLVTGVKPSVFDQVIKSNKQISHDFEIYIRQ